MTYYKVDEEKTKEFHRIMRDGKPAELWKLLCSGVKICSCPDSKRLFVDAHDNTGFFEAVCFEADWKLSGMSEPDKDGVVVREFRATLKKEWSADDRKWDGWLSDQVFVGPISCPDVLGRKL